MTNNLPLVSIIIPCRNKEKVPSPLVGEGLGEGFFRAIR